MVNDYLSCPTALSICTKCHEQHNDSLRHVCSNTKTDHIYKKNRLSSAAQGGSRQNETKDKSREFEKRKLSDTNRFITTVCVVSELKSKCRHEAIFPYEHMQNHTCTTWSMNTLYIPSSLHLWHTHTFTYGEGWCVHEHTSPPPSTPTFHPTPSLILSSQKQRRKPFNYNGLLSRRAQRCIYYELIWLSGAKHCTSWRGRQAGVGGGAPQEVEDASCLLDIKGNIPIFCLNPKWFEMALGRVWEAALDYLFMMGRVPMPLLTSPRFTVLYHLAALNHLSSPKQNPFTVQSSRACIYHRLYYD